MSAAPSEVPEPPELAPADIRERLNQLFAEGQGKRRSHLVALYGRTDAPARVSTAGAGDFDVLPVRSEIELRALVPDDLTTDPHIAFVVPWRGSLPLDIGAFFAGNGRIHPLSRELLVKRRFGAPDIEPGAADTALARFLLEDVSGANIPFAGGRLTTDAMWATWLQHRFDLGDGSVISLEEMLSWAARDTRGLSFVNDTLTRPEVRTELDAWLRRKVGVAGSFALAAWSTGRGPLALAWAIVCEGMRRADGTLDGSDAAKIWRKMKLKEVLAGDDATLEEAARGLAAAATNAFRHLDARDHARANAVLESADKLVDVDEVRAALDASRHLPSAFGRNLDALGAAFKALATEPSASALAGCAAKKRALERHQLSKDASKVTDIERADMAMRLAAWLVQRPDKRVAGGMSAYAEVERLAKWYASEGGFVDWARRRARGAAVKPFDRGVNAVVEAVDTIRADHDRTFARALPAWLSADRPSNVVLPIERAASHFVKSFATEKVERRVLVLLMDGMAWAQAVQILDSLKTWGPIAWSTRQQRGADEAGVRPVLAHLPTVTEISRAAFFAGKRIEPGKAEPTEKDVERWAKNPDIVNVCGPTEVPRLFLRAEGHTQGGAAATDALNAVRDPTQRVVAIVVNAIDASLKGDTQDRAPWSVNRIQPLRDLLDAAAEAKRVVLLASDHGHVPSDRLAHVPGATAAKARWREWKEPNEPLAEFEVGFTKAWAPKGTHGVVLVADDAHRYVSMANAGEHGGASLAEVVAPFMLIGPDVETDDPELRVTPFKEPAWWYPDVGAADESPAPPPVKPTGPKRRESKQIKAQLSLPAVVPPSAAPAHPLRAALEASELLKTRGIEEKTRTQLLDAVGFLASREGGQAPLSLFAQKLGTMTTRAEGLVSRLATNLNVDGFTILRHDPKTQLVELDIEKLKALYGL